MAKAYILDGYSLLFRAYYATAYGPNPTIMRNQEGIPTNAIFALGNMLTKLMTSLNPGDYLFVGLDNSKETFRKHENANYKANRKPSPVELQQQKPIMRELLDSLNIFRYEKEGYEGDDICGTVAKKFSNLGIETLIYTSDRDYLQLIDKNIKVQLIKTGMSNITEVNESNMKELFGFDPIQIIDYKGLRGDTSDNLPGIPGVGEKTAVKLIEQYGTFENIINHADDIGGKVGQSIKDNKELGEMCKRLATIVIDIKLPFNNDDLVYKGFDFATISKFSNKYNLKQLMNKLPGKYKISSAETAYFDDFKKVKSFENISVEDNIGIAIDIEEGNYNTSIIYGVGITSNNDSYYIEIDDAKNDAKLKEILSNPDIKKYCYNFKQIKVALHRYGIEIKGLAFDILLASYLLDSSLNSSLDSVMRLFSIDISSNNDQISLFSNSDPLKTVKTSYYCLKLKNKVTSELDSSELLPLFIDVEIPLTDVLADMEIEGVPLNAEVLENLGEGFKVSLNNAKSKIYELAGEEFNIDSPKQVGEILFNKLGLKSSKGNSTSVEVLKELALYHPIVNEILTYRKYSKLLSTYVTGLLSHIFEDGKIHAMFNQSLTTTGRLSSSEPNLQNISVRDEEGKLIRKAFYYPNHDYEILSLDYSQIELRILASLSNCPSLIEVFESGDDIHASTARKIFHLEKPDSNARRRAKAVNFGIIYGISDWGLSEQIGCSVKEAKAIIDSFYESFPEVGEYFASVEQFAIKNGYVKTMFNRRRYLREIYDANYATREFAKRAASNAPIQGSAADLIKVSMIEVHKFLNENKLKSKLILQIHDELILKVCPEEKDFVYKNVKEIMENCVKLKVKLLVEGGFGTTWYDAK